MNQTPQRDDARANRLKKKTNGEVSRFFEDKGRRKRPLALLTLDPLTDRRARSARVVGDQQGRDGDDNDLRVEAHRPIARVESVTCDALVVRRRAAAADLPEPGYPWPARQVGTDRTRISLELFVGNGTRSDDTHVARENVEQLRKFVQAGFSENSADRSDPRIIAQLAIGGPLRGSQRIRLKEPTQTLRRVRDHGAEFQAVEMLSVETDAPMLEQGRPGRGQSRQGKTNDQ